MHSILLNIYSHVAQVCDDDLLCSSMRLFKTFRISYFILQKAISEICKKGIFSGGWRLLFLLANKMSGRKQRTRILESTRLESYNDPRPSTSFKNGLTLLSMCYVRTYVTYVWTTSSEIMNHFSSLCFGWCLRVDQKLSFGKGHYFRNRGMKQKYLCDFKYFS